MTGSSFYLGLVGLARVIPALAFSLVGGAVADRYDRRAIMGLANAAVAFSAIALGLLTLAGLVQVWHIIVLALITGTAFSFEMPARQSLVSYLVPAKDVVAALSLNAVAFNTAQVLGPALAAILIEAIGEGSVFVLNGLTYVTVVAAAIMMRPTLPATAARGSGNLLANVLEGLRYVRRMPALFALVTSMAVVSLLARPFGQLMPAFARDVLDVGAGGLGALNSAAGAGALAGAVLSAALGSYRGRGQAVVLSAVGFGVALVAFGFSTNFTLSLVLSVVIGLLSAFSGINTNTLLQANSDARMRGRVISLHGLTMMGVVPLGVMLEGVLGSLLGVPLVVILAGLLTSLVALWTVIAAPRVRALS
ncbi:MAG: MFS transporter [Chloroflexota bacterium]|nr:MFS transporter [Chloroflexota bacterium]